MVCFLSNRLCFFYDHLVGRLLYLMKAMVIGSGQCQAETGEMNPLGLQVGPYSHKTDHSLITITPQDAGSDLSFSAVSLAARSRAKRQASIAAKRVVEDGKSQNIVTFVSERDCLSTFFIELDSFIGLST